ncbi:MAG: DUF2752 domain-containing protein [Phycisphaerales bacterium]|jgi:hypothetical protein|nr:DUF2752 domain-containing protein [Phycisphaerales bacterium]
MVGASTSSLSVRGRLVAAVLGVAAASPLVVAATLVPSATGTGTHQALGLPACGWQTVMQVPCPSCGMTTAFAHAANAEFGNALYAQPAGLLLSLLAAMVVLGSVFAALTGAPMQRLVSMFVQPQVVWVGLGILLLGWLFKLAQAGVLS